jgi:hypothetical protein
LKAIARSGNAVIASLSSILTTALNVTTDFASATGQKKGLADPLVLCFVSRSQAGSRRSVGYMKWRSSFGQVKQGRLLKRLISLKYLVVDR